MATADKRKLNINEATREELIDVLGLRGNQADSLLKQREEKGPFASFDDLQDINGIGQATVDHIKGQITMQADKAEEAGRKTAAEGAKAADATADKVQSTNRETADKAAQGVNEAAEASRKTAAEGAKAADATADKVQSTNRETADKAAQGVNEAAEASRKTAAEGAKTAAALTSKMWSVGSETADRTAHGMNETGRKAAAETGSEGAKTAEATAGKVQSIGRELAERNADAAERLLPGSGEAMADTTKLATLFVSYWPEQIGDNFRTLNRLAGAKSFGEAIEIQSSFARGSFERLANRYSSLMQLAMQAGIKGSHALEDEAERRTDRLKAETNKTASHAARSY